MPEREMVELEAERYELEAGPAYRFAPDRRDFFKLMGGGLVVFLVAAGSGEAQESGRGGRRGGNAAPKEVGAWIHIGEDGTVSAFTGKAEVGQNARTALTQAVAEELRMGPGTVRMVMADTDLTPYDMGTFGSLTTPQMAPQLRRAAMAAREALLDLAAVRLKGERSLLRMEDGRVTDPASGKTVTFGELTRGQKLAATISGEGKPAFPLGQSLKKVNGMEMVTGQHRYTPDVKRPGMLQGKVLRAPQLEATLVSADVAGAEKVPGVTVVREGSFVGVAGADAKALEGALAAVKAEWKTGAHPSSKELYGYLKANPEGGEARPARSQGSIETGLAAAEVKVSSEYHIAYIAHVPLEPRAAVAEWKEGKLTVWTGTQRPFGVRTELAQAFGMPEERIRVIVPDTGSGYGGKHTGEAAIEAARLAKGAGKPVKLVWTREEEFTWAYARPAGVIEVRSGATKDGIITAWDYHNYNSGPSAIQPLYEIANQRVVFHRTASPLRQGSYRGLAATANHFARESHIDELAQAAGMEPLAFRMKNLKDGRFRAVLEAAAERFGWGKSKSCCGIAGGSEKGSYVACCAEVSVKGKQVRIERVVTAFECGAIVNPDQLRNQVEGSMIMAIGGALFEEMQFENGRLLNGRLSKYRVPRFGDVPVIETVLVDRKDLASLGAGETPIVGLAPAVGNAIFAATGVRVRNMPMRL